MEDKANNEQRLMSHTQSVEVQTEQSSWAPLKRYQQSDHVIKENETGMVEDQNIQDHSMSYSNRNVHEFETIRLKKTGVRCVSNNEKKKCSETMASSPVADKAKSECDKLVNYAMNADESDLTEMIGASNVEKVLEGRKLEVLRFKEPVSKESIRNKKETLSNSRSFKEIFNFFKDRDRKRNAAENQKISSPEIQIQKLKKLSADDEHGVAKQPLSRLLSLEQSDRETKVKNDAQCAQQTPLMFSRCSSLGSLNSFEQASIHDDHSSVVSDFSRTSGAVSPSDLPSSPTQIIAPSTKNPMSCFGKKKNSFLPEGLKMSNEPRMGDGECNDSSTNDCLKEEHAEASDGGMITNYDANQSESVKEKILKQSIFEDHVTSFKDESTPTRLNSIAASSLSSLTIDDDDDLEASIKDDQNECCVAQPTRRDPIGESKLDEPPIKRDPDFKSGIRSLQGDSKEEKDEVKDLTPYEEQLLDQYIRKGIAKWTKRHENDIKPFSWDVGLTCRATLTLLTSKIVFSFVRDDSLGNKECFKKMTLKNNSGYDTNHRNFKNKNLEESGQTPCLTSRGIRSQKNFGPFYEDSSFINYEEDLLDQCIRKGMAKFTRKSIGDIRPFCWDVSQICLTTKSMMLYDQDDTIIARSNPF